MGMERGVSSNPPGRGRLAVLLVGCIAGGILVDARASAAVPSVERRTYETHRATTPPEIDGRIDDATWQNLPWAGDFVQRDPKEGVPPSQQTQFKVAYDDQAIYFAFRAFDEPGQVRSLLARRDRFPGDWVEVNIDSYFDHRTAFSFTLSLSGTRGDEFVSADGDRWDGNWDPIWQGATHIDEQGWTAEMRIPLSQLRFSGANEQTWGLQVQRRIFRQEEHSTWQPIPKDVIGWVSHFGELRGISGIKPHRRLEVLPYAVAKAEHFEAVPGDPFHDGSSAGSSVGVDGKLGIGSDLTLDFTVNPDFGQVEADPSEVNLTAFETFFEEKRPFFVEGNSIMDLRLAPAITGGDFTNDRLFYSRRIGAPPPHTPDLRDGEYAQVPDVSSILGAFKLSGKTAHGLSIGVLDSVTQRERSLIDFGGVRRQEDVSPFTNYFVGRVQQDLRGGDTQFGLMLTSVRRSIVDPQLQFLPEQAWSGGADFLHYFAGRSFLLEGNLLGSALRGTPQAIEEAQTSSARYFQRPDNDSAVFDPFRTSLGGHAGSLRLTRTASNSRIRFQTGVAWRSPGFEINDLGFMRSADEINQFGWGAYQIRNPFGIFRRLQVNVNEWLDWDFAGTQLRRAANTNASATFRNNIQAGGGITRDWQGVSNTQLRGGPSSTWPGKWQYELWVRSDSRKPVSVNAGVNGRRGDAGSDRFREVWMDLIYRPTNALTLTLSPSANRSQPELQYVDTPVFAGGNRYVFGSLDQHTKALTLRVDLAITPNLTVQYYGAPFLSSGRYSELKRIVAPRAAAYRDRFAVYSPAEITAAGATYQIDENHDGRPDYSFDRPDFDVRDFNSTLVARWEYRPGSQVFLVWSQARLDETLRDSGLTFGRGLDQLFGVHPHDVFLVKFSKWFSL